MFRKPATLQPEVDIYDPSIYTADTLPVINTPAPANPEPEAKEETKEDLIDVIFWFLLVRLPIAIILGCSISFIVLYTGARLILSNSSNVDHGSDITQFVENVRYLDYEIHADFGPSGVKYSEVTQHEFDHVTPNSTLAVIADKISFGEYIAVHNHPLDYPFSISDLCNISLSDSSAKHRIVISPNNIYELVIPSDNPPDNDTVCTYLQPYLTNFEEAANLGLVSLTYLDEENVEIATTDKLLQQFAADFGLTYTVTPIDEWKFN